MAGILTTAVIPDGITSESVLDALGAFECSSRTVAHLDLVEVFEDGQRIVQIAVAGGPINPAVFSPKFVAAMPGDFKEDLDSDQMVSLNWTFDPPASDSVEKMIQALATAKLIDYVIDGNDRVFRVADFPGLDA